MRILLIEDEQDTLNALKLLLAFDGFDVVTANNGAQGYREYLKKRPELVITDANMPELDGFELISIIRADPELPKIPIIVISAYGAKGSERALRAGANFYLSKPYEYEALLNTIYHVTTHDHEPAIA